MDKDKPLEMRVRETAPPKPRRVYKSVSFAADDAGLFAVRLDGKPALTPLRTPLASKARALIEAVAAEWDAQDPHVDPETMPLTRLLATEIDRVAPQRQAVVDNLLTFIDADSICYRAAHPADLRERQRASWQTIADWLLREHDIALTSTEGLMPATQAPGTAPKMRKLLERLNDAELNGFQAAASLTNSLALAFALVHKKVTAADCFAAAFLDELYQVEKWGEDTEAHTRRQRIAGDLNAVERYLALSI
ncbi:MAG: ATPase [Rhodospirillaceae bacterium]|nr:ATPase [Rhodospirillaceae bacterium]